MGPVPCQCAQKQPAKSIASSMTCLISSAASDEAPLKAGQTPSNQNELVNKGEAFSQIQ